MSLDPAANDNERFRQAVLDGLTFKRIGEWAMAFDAIMEPGKAAYLRGAIALVRGETEMPGEDREGAAGSTGHAATSRPPSGASPGRA